MNITRFDDLIAAARSQPQPLLMVSVDVEMLSDASPQERARFKQGRRGTPTPRMCLDRTAGELTDWPTLATEADQPSPAWRMVMAAALSGRQGQTARAANPSSRRSIAWSWASPRGRSKAS